MLYCLAVVSIFALRLWIWKFFPGLESGIKDDLSNMIIASLVFGLAIFFFLHQAVRRRGIVRSGIDGPVALLMAAAVMSLAWSADLSLSIKGSIMLLVHVFFFYILLHTLLEGHQRRIFLWAFFIGSVVVAGFGINDIIILSQVSPEAVESARLTNKSLYYILVNKRACSLFGWPNVLAGFLMLSMPLTAGLCVTAREKWLKAIVALGGAMMVAAFFLTFSFLGWTGFLITVAVCLAVFLQRRLLVVSPTILKFVASGVVLMVVLFAVVVVKKDMGGAAVPRKEYARVVCEVIREHPFRGTGFGAYRFASMKFVRDVQGETAFAHNAYAQVWAETGLAGLAAVLWLAVLLFVMARRILSRVKDGTDKIMFLAVLVGLAAFFVDNINSFTLLKPNVAFFFWVWLAIFCSYGADRADILPSRDKFRRGMMLFLAGVAVAGLFVSARSLMSLANLRTGQEAAQAGVFELARQSFQRAHALDPFDGRILTAEGDLYFRAFRSTSQVAWRDEAQRVFLQATACAPNYHYNYLALASIYGSQGNRVAMDAVIAKARAVSPYETERDLRVFSRPQ